MIYYKAELTYLPSYLPMLAYIFRNRITICTKCLTNFQNLCSCLFPGEKHNEHCFLNLKRKLQESESLCRQGTAWEYTPAVNAIGQNDKYKLKREKSQTINLHKVVRKKKTISVETGSMICSPAGA